MMHRVVELFFFDAGGGHRSAANALRESMAVTHPDWTVRLVNLQDLLEKIDPVSRISRFQSQDLYNGILKRGWTFGSVAMLRGMQIAIRLLTPLCEERLRDRWRTQRPDMVVSVIPNFNGILRRALAAVHPAVPYVTIMTDMADYPSHFWQEEQDQYLVCGTDKAMAQARALGYGEDRLFRTSGMILNPKFYRTAPQDGMTLESLGLDPALPTALIMFGGYGAAKAARIAALLREAARPVQSIVICGHNAKLREKLQRRAHCHAVGFTDDVPGYMRLADFFIGKPGPGSISEALQMGLPVIVECNARTLPQERYNATWVTEQGVGLAVKSLTQIPTAADRLTDPALHHVWRDRVSDIVNKAVFEIPDMLADILGRHTAASGKMAAA